jgi:type IV pilus assembly protein PilE
MRTVDRRTATQRHRHHRHHHHGFTLVEVMFVLVIMSILAALAFPTYRDAIVKARRAEGRAALMLLMQQQERYYSQNNRYLAFSSSSTDMDQARFRWHSGPVAESSAYELSARACENEAIETCVELKAEPGTPRVDSRFRDDDCNPLVMTSTGIMTPSDNGKRCWE